MYHLQALISSSVAFFSVSLPLGLQPSALGPVSMVGSHYRFKKKIIFSTNTSKHPSESAGLGLLHTSAKKKKSGSGKDLTQTSRGKGDVPLKVKIVMKEQE